ncbi:hypothetical protein LVD15_10185 [Fulvivirga maritima]|uniref:hypothetical protein n=1 Tax=Fulvivirga maritima TaxID=2904247 RepID=UPI001F186A68|nr:hypothetical protein [Fulvivirga maritima]UII28770.1 hypothetical protein LVD15_10185 [Fulvivirga maritima]
MWSQCNCDLAGIDEYLTDYYISMSDLGYTVNDFELLVNSLSEATNQKEEEE